jgi:hypothetical protein
MELSMSEIRILIEAVGMLDAEYGLDATGAALLDRLRKVRDRRTAEIEAGR